MSFLKDLIGGYAKAGSDVLDDVIKENTRERELKETRQAELERQIAAEKRQHDLAIERDRVVRENQAALEQRLIAERQARLSKQNQEVDEEAESASAARQLARIQALPPGMAGEAFENLKKGTGKTYGVDAGNDPLGKLGTKIDIARKKGYYDVEADLRKLRSDTIAEMTAEHRRQAELRRLDQTDDRLEQTIRRGEQQHAEAMARIGKSDKDKSDEKLASLTSRKNQAIRALSNYDRAGVDKTDPDYVAEVEELRTVNALLKGQGKKADAPAPSTPRASQFKVIRPGATK